MPLYTPQYVACPTLRLTRSVYSSNWDGASRAWISWGFDRKAITKPTTSSRVMPLDLFEGKTGRTVETVIVNSAVGNYSGDYTMYIGMPASIAADFSNLSSPSVAPPSRAAMYNQIRMQMRGDYVNLGMALAEYRQTAKLFYDLAKIVSSRGRSLKAGWKTSKPKAIAKANLGFQYGVKPLAYDILGSVKELSAAAARPSYIGGVIRCKTSGSSYSTKRTVPFDSRAIPVVDSATVLYQYKSAWRAKLRAPSVVTTLAAHGLTNPFALAYEVIPYSFVIDWWINLGDVLSSLDNLLMFESLRVADSQRVITRKEVTLTGKYFGNLSATQIVITDTRYGPVDLSMVATLAYKPSVSKQHILNGLSLLAVARR